MGYTGFSDSAGEMRAETASLTTKADKIRALAKAGYTRQQIADFLGVRYQHVRNVLVDDERRAKAAGDDAQNRERQAPRLPRGMPAKPPKRTHKVKLGPGNQLALPPHMLEALGWKEGDTIWVRLDGEGEIRLQDVHALTRTVQAWGRTLGSGGENSTDVLHEERRLQLEREERLCGG